MKTEQSKTADQDEKFEQDFHFADEAEAAYGIETAVYKNGNKIKRFTLSKGQQAIVRELLGHDSLAIDKIVATSNNPDKEALYMNALFYHAVKIDGVQIPIEDFAAFKMKDYTKMKIAVQSLNF